MPQILLAYTDGTETERHTKTKQRLRNRHSHSHTHRGTDRQTDRQTAKIVGDTERERERERDSLAQRHTHFEGLERNTRNLLCPEGRGAEMIDIQFHYKIENLNGWNFPLQLCTIPMDRRLWYLHRSYTVFPTHSHNRRHSL
eukprot:2237900-Rhodomonas_salina.3